MNPTDVYLHTYTGQTLVVLRYIDVQVEYESQALILLLIVKKCQGPSLFRQNWLEKIKLNLSAIHIVNMLSALHNLLQNIRIFSQSAGNTKRVSCSINHRSYSSTSFFQNSTGTIFTQRENWERVWMVTNSVYYHTSIIFRMGCANCSCCEKWH